MEGTFRTAPLDGPKTYHLRCRSRRGDVTSTVQVAVTAPAPIAGVPQPAPEPEPVAEPPPTPVEEPPPEPVEEPLPLPVDEPEPVIEPVPEPVPAPAPTLTFRVEEREVTSGGFTVLTWTTTGAQECLASGGWTGTRGPDGSESIGPIRASTTYALNCSGPGGNTIEMVSVSALGSISISWRAPTQTVDGSPLTDLAGYRIYYGSASRNYLTIVELDDPMAQDYTFTAASGDYFVAMTALDSQDNESTYSNEILRSVP